MRRLYYDVWPAYAPADGVRVMLAAVVGNPHNPSYVTWSVETIGM